MVDTRDLKATTAAASRCDGTVEGIGASGMGYYGSKLGFDEFTHFRAVLHRGKYFTQPMFPPPDDSMYDTVVRMLVTGFVTDTQLKMLKATAAAILGFLVFRPKL